MAQIMIQNLTFAYDGGSENIFDNANFMFDTNWKIGLIGRNGRGKTTFLNLLLGKLEYKGKILASVHFDYFPFEGLDMQSNAIDLLPQIYEECELWQVMKNMKQLELDDEILYRPFSSLSNGQQTKFLLAALFSRENNFLLIDEPTNHLDSQSRDCVCKFLKNQKGFIVVSHDRAFIDECVDHIISINKNDIEVQKGNFSSWWQNRKNQDNFEFVSNEKLEKDIARLKENALKTKQWADKVEKTKGTRVSGVKVDKGYVSHQAARMMQRSKVAQRRQEKLIEEKSKLLKNIESQDELFLNSQKLGKENVLEVKDLSINYDNNIIFKNLSFDVKKGERVAICGRNGCGKTSLIKLLLGQDISHRGEIYKSGRLKISYISQRYDYLQGLLIDFARDNKLDQTRFLTMLRKLGFERGQFENDIKSFSAGQKKKVLIAKSLCEEANLYIWDEPLNYIDIISRMQIEEMLLDANITIIFIEHDQMFIDNIATKVVQLDNFN